eukprot:6918969-Prymnesium_polylepis.1
MPSSSLPQSGLFLSDSTSRERRPRDQNLPKPHFEHLPLMQTGLAFSRQPPQTSLPPRITSFGCCATAG